MPPESGPLSFAQQRLWFLDQMSPGTPVYIIPIVADLEGPLDVGAFTAAINEIVRRHEPLRTVFVWKGSEPSQRVEPFAPIPVPLRDLSGLPADRRHTEAERRIDEEICRPFDLERGPLLRAQLIKYDESHHVLAGAVHHIVFDGWSSGVFFRELGALYKAFVAGAPSPVPPLPLSYIEFSVRQREAMTGSLLSTQLAYWKERLKAPRSVLVLSGTLPRPAEATPRGRRDYLPLSERLWAATQAFGRREGATFFMTLLAAYAALLHRASRQDDLLIGTPIANRTQHDLEPLIGFFVNTLVLRLNLSGDPTFRQLLAQARKVALGAYDNQDAPFDRVVEELRPPRSGNQLPLLQTMLVLQNSPTSVGEQLAMGDVTLKRRQTSTGTAKFDLMLSMRRSSAGPAAVLETSADLFDEAGAMRLLREFESLLDEAITHPDRRLSELGGGSSAPSQPVQDSWNATSRPFDLSESVVAMFDGRAALQPQADAVLWGGERLSYRALQQQATELALRLRQVGVGADMRVGVCLERSPAMVVALLAVLKAGAAYVPLDPVYPARRLSFIIEDAGCRVVLSRPGLLPCDVPPGCRVLDVGETAAHPDEKLGVAPGAGHLAYVIYTSGSTGQPKGVAVEHHSLTNLVGWARETFTESELACVLASTSVSFDLSVFEIFVPLATGGAIALVDTLLSLPEAPAAGRVTFVNTVPSVLRELLRHHAIPSGVRLVALAGEPLSPELVDRIHARGFTGRVFDLYGPTETTVYATASLRLPGGPATIGRPIANTEALVLDEERQPVAVGVTGELFLGGAGVARGYLDRGDLTAERFVRDPRGGSGMFYRTGDLVQWRPDGTLAFLGRADRQVKVRGVRIELDEVEAALSAHPGVRAAAAVTQDDGAGGVLVAFVVAESMVADEALYHQVAERMPHYMVPSLIARREALPRLPNGKVDYLALASDATAREQTPRTAPRTPTEAAIAGVWREVLQRPEVGISENFFWIGGHSLLAMQVTARLRALFGDGVAADAVFRAPTIAEQALLVESGRG